MTEAQKDQNRSLQHWNNEKNIRMKLEQLEEQEQIMWMQKSRVNWILQGDKNFKFYHSITVKRRIFNQIQGVWNDQGIWMNNHEDIVSSFWSYYKKVFSPPKDLQKEFIIERISRMNIPNLNPN